jgi:hypothetical protein
MNQNENHPRVGWKVASEPPTTTDGTRHFKIGSSISFPEYFHGLCFSTPQVRFRFLEHNFSIKQSSIPGIINMAPSAVLPDPEPEYVVVHAGKGTIKRQVLTGAQKKPTFDTIPQVDFSNMCSSSIEERRAMAKEVGTAFRNSGFLYAMNHGIPEELQSDLYRVIKDFFDLPLEEKMKVGDQIEIGFQKLTMFRFM